MHYFKHIPLSYFSAGTVKWIRSDGSDFEMERRARMEYDGNMTFSMTIHNIRKEDRGEFSCVANNNLGREIVKRAVLKVNCK